MDILIDTDRLLLRQLKEADAEALCAVCNQEYILKRMPDWAGTVDDIKRSIRWFESQYALADKDSARVVLAVILKEIEELIGVVGIGNKEEVENEIEIAFFISQVYCNNGYTSEAAKAMIKWAFATLKLDYLMAIVEPDNMPSQRVVEKCGLTRLGTKMILNSGDTVVKPFYYYRIHNQAVI